MVDNFFNDRYVIWWKSMLTVGRIDGRMDRHDEVIGIISQIAF